MSKDSHMPPRAAGGPCSPRRASRWRRILRVAILGVVIATLAALRADRFVMGLVDQVRHPVPSAPSVRPAQWAQRVDMPGLTNVYRVSPELYRSAQPEGNGWNSVRELGVRSVVSLRCFHSDQQEADRLGLGYRGIGWVAARPEDEDVVAFLRHVTNRANQPVLVHCQYGSDRTGTMCAMYRMCVQGWPREQAIQEMTEGGFGFHPEWVNLVEYLRTVDVEKISRQAGLTIDAASSATSGRSR